MVRLCHRSLAAAVAGLALLAGCGSDHGARERFNQVRSACEAALGTTRGDLAAFPSDVPPEVACGLPGLAPIDSSDFCGGSPGAPYAAPVCVLAFEYCASGTSLCSGGPAGGCAYDCELRVVAASATDIKVGSVICATRFISGQPFGPLTGRSCR